MNFVVDHLLLECFEKNFRIYSVWNFDVGFKGVAALVELLQMLQHRLCEAKCPL